MSTNKSNLYDWHPSDGDYSNSDMMNDSRSYKRKVLKRKLYKYISLGALFLLAAGITAVCSK